MWLCVFVWLCVCVFVCVCLCGCVAVCGNSSCVCCDSLRYRLRLPPPFGIVNITCCRDGARCIGQLEYYLSLFRVAEDVAVKLPSSHRKAYSELADVASTFLSKSAYHVVDAAVTFGYIDKMKKPGTA